MTRETPEPLTPEEAIDALLALLPGTLGHDRAILAAAENIATVALRAATPDPDCRIAGQHRHVHIAEGPHMLCRAATPDPAERIEGLRDRAQRQGTWGIEYGDDRFYDDVMDALRTATPDPEACPGCGSRYADEAEMYCSNCGRAATPDPAEPRLREALRAAVRESEQRGYATVTVARADLAALLAALADTTEGQS